MTSSTASSCRRPLLAGRHVLKTLQLKQNATVCAKEKATRNEEVTECGNGTVSGDMKAAVSGSIFAIFASWRDRMVPFEFQHDGSI